MASKIFRVETVEHLNFLGHGLIAASVLNTGIRLGLFDALGDRPKTTGELEKKIGLDTRGCLAILSASAALGLVEREGEVWKNSAVSDKYLVQGKPAYMGTYFARTMYDGQYKQMGSLLDTLKSGKPAAKAMVYGDDWKSQARTMIPGQHEGSLATATYLMKKKKVDLTGAKAFLDLGCGSGAYSIAACQHYPQLRACCIDFKEILEVTKEYIEANGLSDRIKTRELSYLDDPLPEGFDVIWFGGTLNGYSARQIRTIFIKAHGVLPEGGKLLLYDYFIYNDRTGPLFSTLQNLNNLVGSSEAHILTLEEMEQIQREIGFKNIQNEPLVNEMTWLFSANK